MNGAGEDTDKQQKVELFNKKKTIGSTGVDMDSYTELKFENNFKSKMGVSFIKDLGRKTKIIGSSSWPMLVSRRVKLRPAMERGR